MLGELIGLFLVAKGAEWLFSENENQGSKQSSNHKNRKSKKQRKRERKKRLEQLLEEARRLRIKIPGNIQNTAPENLEKIEELLGIKKQLWKKYEALERRAREIGWNQSYPEQYRSEASFEQQERRIIAQERLFVQFVSLQKKGASLGWQIPQPIMPMSEWQLQRIQSELDFYHRWYSEFAEQNRWLPAPWKIALPPTPYTEKDLVHRIALLRERKQQYKRLLLGIMAIFLVFVVGFYI